MIYICVCVCVCVCIQVAQIFQKSKTLLKILAAEEWHEASSLLGATAPGFVHSSTCIYRLITNENIKTMYFYWLIVQNVTVS
jgi:hypothetical protein